MRFFYVVASVVTLASCGRVSDVAHVNAYSLQCENLGNPIVSKQMGRSVVMTSSGTVLGTFTKEIEAAKGIEILKKHGLTQVCQYTGSELKFFQDNTRTVPHQTVDSGEKCEAVKTPTIVGNKVTTGTVSIASNDASAAYGVRSIILNKKWNNVCKVVGSEDFLIWMAPAPTTPLPGTVTPAPQATPTPPSHCNRETREENCIGYGYCSHEENGIIVYGSYSSCNGTARNSYCGGVLIEKGRCQVN